MLGWTKKTKKTLWDIRIFLWKNLNFTFIVNANEIKSLFYIKTRTICSLINNKESARAATEGNLKKIKVKFNDRG